MANEEVLGSRKTMFVLVIVVGCFAVLWPRILGPLLLGPAARPAQFDRDAGCCEVIFESEVAVLELVNEVCSSAVGSDGKMSPFAANECRKTVNETCGLDIAAFLKRSDNVGKSTKALLQTMKQSNSSCLKEHFGVPIWSIGVHTALNSWTQQDTMKQERSPIRAGPHPALRERGRAIPVNAPTPPSRAAVSMPPHARVRSPLSAYFEHEVAQPPPIPGMRPPLGSPGGPVPAPKSSMGFVMPIYTICIIVFFVYTLSKILFKRTGSIPYEQVSPDPHFRRRVFRDDSRSSPETKLGHKERDAIVTAISGLVAEVHQQMEANYAQSQQRQEAENHSRTYTNGSVLKSSPNIVASEFVEQKEKSPEPEKPKDASPEPEKPSEKSPSPELSPEKEPEPELSPEKSDSSPDKEPESSPEKDPEPTPERSSPEKELSPEESPERETTPDNVESNPHQSGSIEDDLLKLTEDIKEKKENLARSTEEFLNDAKESLNEAEDEAWKDEEEFSNEAEDKALKDEEELLNEASDNALKDEEEFLNEATNKALKDEEFLNEAEAEALRNEEEVLNDMKESLNEAKEFMNEAKEETVKLLKEALKEDSVEEEEDEDEPEPDVSVKVVGMELTAHAAGGRAPPAPPAPTPPAQRSHEADEVTSIFLETRIPQQSRVLVAEFEDKTKPAPRRHDPMVVSGKMTLSLIQDAPRDTPERDPESTVTDFTTASAMTQPVAEKDGESSGEEIEEEIEIEEIEEEEEQKKQEAKE